MSGPLSGLRIIELGGIGPGPFAGMLLADHGAEVIRIDRPGFVPGKADTMLRSRKLVHLDLKKSEDLSTVRALVKTADGLIEGYRPGTVERLGIGPEILIADNPRLVYGRMTGWGQTGPYARLAGHDINYIALTGALEAIGPADRPVPPLALIGDLGGGGVMLAFSMCSALLHAQRTGLGQVIDCAMVDGAALLMTMFYELSAKGAWRDGREANLLDGGAHFYRVYETSDRKFVSVGAIEPQFYAALLDRLGLTDDQDFAQHMDPTRWPKARNRLTTLFRTKTRDEWCKLFANSDACFAPVLSMSEAPAHNSAAIRESFVCVEGVTQPAPMPRFSETRLDAPQPAMVVDAHSLL
jgi:alpha-methylacyl-CoA racemase